ncbi:VPLPA-CTERM sorting domain-containing protein [Lichenifustis flavocetrariae]|uniref:VPLPA-CTERM sorting domain-containing protein n=1 Tax=Lichenifustis flavocetrariae TaxID=2949735 RepID=A0AA41Z320_9HYPH|nr:VPLPA-CTERM sorting domain-containing protein [Lichenifustis flavocetrariae]MCW6509445.1 VPLPA-CTERM sorting domain-containing protein [Lichenifustis flavocetrariae]
MAAEVNLASKVIFVSAILTASAAPASATTIEYAISGKVIGGYDSSGLFGGGDLTGKSFVALETFNTDNAASSYASTGGSGANGGSKANGLSFISVDLTIDSASESFADYTSNVSVSTGSQFNSFVQSALASNASNIGFYIKSLKIKSDYANENNLDGLSGSYSGYYTRNNDAGQQVVYANFEVTSFAAVSAVPLPASAPLFGAALIALSSVGYGMKRKKVAAGR